MQLTNDVALVGSGGARLGDRYDCNVYALDAPDGTVLVDTGAGASVPELLDRAEAAFGEVTHALLTHAHADHSQGGPDCRRHGVEVVASEQTARLLREGTERELGVDVARDEGVYPAGYEFENYTADRTFSPGERIAVAGTAFETVPVRGHAPDHVAFLTGSEDGTTTCFVGDAVYPDGSISLLNVPGSSLADYRADIDGLADRGVDRLLPGHGLPLLADGQDAIDEARRALEGMSTPPSRT
jgi:glyoxylase-like metal-dependent hydrolase (beta-lactamase superfamily II)